MSSSAPQRAVLPTGAGRLLDEKNTAVTIRTLTRAAEAAGLEISFTVRQKSPAELTDLARQLAGEKSPAKVAALKKSLAAGFYGQA